MLILFSLFAILPIHGGCIYFPIPALDLKSQKGVVPDETIKSLRQGKSTRADVLLLLGDPDERREQDRFFIYEWVAEEGMVGIAFGEAYVTKSHFFCVEFNETNEIKRHAHFKSGLFKKRADIYEKCVDG